VLARGRAPIATNQRCLTLLTGTSAQAYQGAP